MAKSVAREADTSITELAGELERLRDDLLDSNRSMDALFALWFLTWYATDDDLPQARGALTNATGDRDVDAVHINDDRKYVLIVQSKYRRQLAPEKAKDVNALADLAVPLWTSREALTEHTNAERMNPLALEKLLRAQERLLRRKGYRLELCYVTTGYIPAGVKTGATRRASRAAGQTRLDYRERPYVLRLLRDFLDGHIRVPELTLPVRAGAENSTGYIYREDGGLNAWIFTLSGLELADMLRKAGERVFDRNIRGFQGRTEVNADIVESVKDQPKLFWYLNNGVTILCDERSPGIRGQGRNTKLILEDAQIINGQQTTRVLHGLLADRRHRANLERCSVLVRVIRVPSSGPRVEPEMSYDEFVASVVQATNWQNRIDAEDLVSNDRRQIRLGRLLRRFGYEYARKRGTIGQLKKAVGQQRVVIEKSKLAQAIAGCEYDCLPLRVGKKPLFEQKQSADSDADRDSSGALAKSELIYYHKLFPADEAPAFFLSRYWVVRGVEAVIRERVKTTGEKELWHFRWPVVYFVWRQVGSLIERNAHRFHTTIAKETPATRKVLDQLIRAVFDAAKNFWWMETRGAEERDDFYKPGKYKDLLKYWRLRSNRSRVRRFKKARSKLEQQLNAKT